MKTLAFAMLIPLAVCTGMSVESSAAQPARSQSPATTPDEVPRTTAQVELMSAAGSSVKGNLTLKSEGLAVLLTGEITGLKPGQEHGFHVHEVGQCTLPDFKSAGELFNPARNQHGAPDSNSKHLGDMPNAKADDNGRAEIEVRLEGATLEDKDGGPNQLLGKAVVVHAMPDDYKTQPSGGSGDRIACGVIS